MTGFATCELILIRHAPAETGGRLCGRQDVPACLDDRAAVARLGEMLTGVRQIVTSPALRCRQTAQALFPNSTDLPEDPRLWEQDFGEEDGMAMSDLPDLGPLSNETLAARRPPNGESFVDMVARVRPALQDVSAAAMIGGPLAVVAHAGTVRAALAFAMGSTPVALSFEVAPLSVTRLRCFEGGHSIISVNVAV